MAAFPSSFPSPSSQAASSLSLSLLQDTTRQQKSGRVCAQRTILFIFFDSFSRNPRLTCSNVGLKKKKKVFIWRRTRCRTGTLTGRRPPPRASSTTSAPSRTSSLRTISSLMSRRKTEPSLNSTSFFFFFFFHPHTTPSIFFLSFHSIVCLSPSFASLFDLSFCFLSFGSLPSHSVWQTHLRPVPSSIHLLFFFFFLSSDAAL